METVEKLNRYDGFEVIDRFQINKNQHCSILTEWLKATSVLDDFDTLLLQKAQKELIIYEREWNEEELKVNFVSFVIFLSQLNEREKIKTFFERRLSGKVNDIPISVVVDCMIATPMKSGRPNFPYFFLQEFKRSISDDHDRSGGPSRRANARCYDFSPRVESRWQTRLWLLVTR
jgi:hypothetical protein